MSVQRDRFDLRAAFQPEMPQHLAVEALLVILDRHLVDRRGVEGGDHRLFAEIAEQRDLLARAQRNLAVAAAQQHVGLDADALQLLDRMLGRLGLELARRRNPRHQGQVNEQRAVAAKLVAQLADGFEERQALDVADRAADLAEQEIGIAAIGADELLDRVGDVRNDLHGAAEIVAAALLGDHVGIDPPGRDVVRLPRRHAGEPLVMTEIKIGLGPVVGDVDFAVLVGTHRPGIDVEIGVQLAQSHPETTRLQERAERRRCKTFSKRGDHAAGYEDEPRHGTPPYTAGLDGTSEALKCLCFRVSAKPDRRADAASRCPSRTA